MNRASKFAAVAIAGLALFGAGPATATTVQKFSLADLAKKSETIVLARVEDETARWDDGKKEIYTYVTLRVLDPVKGMKANGNANGKAKNDEETITIRQLGGTVDNLTSIVPGTPSFRRGEEVVVFLSAKDNKGYPWVVGLQQGKYTVFTDDQGFKQVRNDVDGMSTMAPDGSVTEAKVSKSLPLQAFLDGIKTQLDSDGKVKVDPNPPTE
jgi:hypothetical protein